MSTPLDEYVAALARTLAGQPDDPAQRARIATALPSLLALAARLGPWPTSAPAGPLEPSE